MLALGGVVGALHVSLVFYEVFVYGLLVFCPPVDETL